MKHSFIKIALVTLLGMAITAQAATPNSAVDFVKDGNARQTGRDLKGASADYNRAVALDPKFAVHTK